MAYVYRRPFDYAIYAKRFNRFVFRVSGGSQTVGSSSGVATVSGISAVKFTTIASSSGVAVATGLSLVKFTTVGSSSGVATVTGVGDSVALGSTVGSSSGVATVTGVGASKVLTVGVSHGVATVNGVSVPVASTGGGSTLSAKESRKEKKRRKKQEISAKIIQNEVDRRRGIKAQEPEKPKAKDKKVDRRPDTDEPIDLHESTVKPRPFIPDTRLSDSLLVVGESSSFLTDALKRQQFVQQAEQKIFAQQLAEQDRLNILADDEMVIALYMERRRQLIAEYLVTK